MEIMQFIHGDNIRSIEVVKHDDHTIELVALVEKKHVLVVQHVADLRQYGFYRAIVDYEEMDTTGEVTLVDAAIYKGLKADITNDNMATRIEWFFPRLIKVELQDPDGNITLKFVAKELVINDWHDLAYGLTNKTPINQHRPEWLDNKIL
jgi:hypothetical protein